MDTTKKEGNRKQRKKGSEGQNLRKLSVMGYCNCPFIGHPEKIENRKGRSGRWTQQKKKKIENQEKKDLKARI